MGTMALREPNIVLQQEDCIEEQCNNPQCQLDKESSDPRPMAADPAIQQDLHDGKDTTSEIQHDVDDGPAGRALPHIVHVHLGDVLYHSQCELDVGEEVEEVEPWDYSKDRKEHGYTGSDGDEDGGTGSNLAHGLTRFLKRR